VLHKLEMVRHWWQVFWSARLSIVKDRFWFRPLAVDMLVGEVGLGRTLEVAWDAYHIGLRLDMCCNILRGFGNWDRILLVVAYLRAIDGMLVVGDLC